MTVHPNRGPAHLASTDRPPTLGILPVLPDLDVSCRPHVSVIGVAGLAVRKLNPVEDRGRPMDYDDLADAVSLRLTDEVFDSEALV